MTKVTSKDVARLANVSHATVSYVLNNTPGKSISAETRERILSAVRELNYVPNSAAKRLKLHRSNCIAVRLATTLSIPRYYLALQGIRAFLEPLGYNILLFNDKRTQQHRNYLDACLNTQADGILYISDNYEDVPEDVMAVIRRNNIPLSAIDCMGSVPDVNSINYDYSSSISLRAEKLIQLGYRHLLYVGPELPSVKNHMRENGFRSALQERADITWQIRHYAARSDGSTAAYDAAYRGRNQLQSTTDAVAPDFMRKLAAETTPDTAIICSYPNDQNYLTMQLALRHAAHPEEDPNWYRRSISFEYDHFGIGYEAARSLIDAINNAGSPRKLLLQPWLIPTDPAGYPAG